MTRTSPTESDGWHVWLCVHVRTAQLPFKKFQFSSTVAQLTTEGAGSFGFPRKLALLKSTADTERIKRELRQFLIDKIGDTILVL